MANGIRTYREVLDEEKRCREAIHEDLRALRTVSDLRSYIALRRSHVTEPDARLEEWLGWVARYADRLEAEVLAHAGPNAETLSTASTYAAAGHAKRESNRWDGRAQWSDDAHRVVDREVPLALGVK